jgi:hypothetical protein
VGTNPSPKDDDDDDGDDGDDGHHDRHDHDDHDGHDDDTNVPKGMYRLSHPPSSSGCLEAPKPWHPSQDRENQSSVCFFVSHNSECRFLNFIFSCVFQVPVLFPFFHLG